MRATTFGLGVDVGSAATKAVLATPDGGRVPLAVEGVVRMPSGVFVDPGGALLVGEAARAAGTDRPSCYLADPAAHLSAGEVDVAGRTVGVVDLYAAILSAVRMEAVRFAGLSPQVVALVVPPQWGPKRRGVVQEAARRVGFTEVATVSAPAAVAAYWAASNGLRPAPDGCLLVCDAGAAELRLTVLQQAADGLHQLATGAVEVGGGHAVDRLIAVRLLDVAEPAQSPHAMGDARDPQWLAIVRAAQVAKESLTGLDRTAVALPGDYPVVALSRAELASLLEPVMDRVAAQVTDVLRAADVERSHLAAVVLTGGGAHVPGLAHALQVTSGQPPVVPDRNDLAQADGALTATGITENTPGARAPLPTVRPGVTDIVRPVLVGAASLVLLGFAIATVWTTGSARLAVDIHLATEVISAAAVAAMLAAWASAHLVPSIYLAGESAGSQPAAQLARRSFLGAAGFGLAAAVIYGMAAGGVFRISATQYLGYALYAALPVVAAMLVIAVLAPAIPPGAQPAWLAGLRLPIVPVLLATVGILLMRYAVTQPSNLIPVGPGFLARVGAALTGVAIALTVARNLLIRVAGGVLLAIGGLVVGSLTNTRLVILGYVAAAIWWAALAAGQTVRAAYPTLRRWLRERGA